MSLLYKPYFKVYKGNGLLLKPLLGNMFSSYKV